MLGFRLVKDADLADLERRLAHAADGRLAALGEVDRLRRELRQTNEAMAAARARSADGAAVKDAEIRQLQLELLAALRSLTTP